MNYTPKVGLIHVTALTAVNTWQQVLTAAQAKGISGFKIKGRYVYGAQKPRPFSYAFCASPATGNSTAGNGFWSNSGSGSGDTAGPTSGIWASSPVSGTVIEIMIYT